MIIITSAAYLSAEFQAECGRLPPSMLPLRNRRLYEHQVSALRSRFAERPIFLSLPDDYDLSEWDARSLAGLNVETVRVPAGLTLAESLIYVLNSIPAESTEVGILHGDTLVREFPAGNNLIGVVGTRDDYDWEVETVDDAGEVVWCGYFHFAHARELLRCLTAARGRFVDALRAYDRLHPLGRCEVEGWDDLGHANTYFQTRARWTAQRSFNNLEIQDGCVVKTGQPAQKIRAEAAWFAGLPAPLKRFAPQLVQSGEREQGQPWYAIEYLCLLPLNELFVHGRNPVFVWARLFGHCSRFLERCQTAVEIPPDAVPDLLERSRELIEDKTWARLSQFAGARGLSLDEPTRLNGRSLPSLRHVAARCIGLSLAQPVHPSFVHGDLCFSNILFDPRSDAIKVIDPRGLDHRGRQGSLGDIRYDLAKLCHSVVGLYDFIIAGAFESRRTGDLSFQLDLQIDRRIIDIQQAFRGRSFLPGVTIDDMMPLTTLLFLSMLPLHADDPARQDALLANALRLYSENIPAER